MIRDDVKNEIYWKNYSETSERIIRKLLETLGGADADPRKKMSLSYSYRRKVFNLFSSSYSSGCRYTHQSRNLEEVFDAFFLFLGVCREQPDRSRERYFYAYDERTRDLALAILFNADRGTVDRLVEAVDFWPGKDAIWEKMIAHLGVTGREPVEAIQWPEAYESLWHCFICPEGDRPAQLKRFVDNWYKEMKKGGKAWVDSHKSKHDVYCGYWCFEAAGVAKMLGIDDSALKGHPHYPYDLVHPELEG